MTAHDVASAVDETRGRELLARERERIEGRLGEFAHERADQLAHDDQHGEDRSAEQSMDEVDQALVEQLQEELATLERAEGRLVNGTFGLSIESGEHIPDARLEALPTAERTVEEQARYDRGR